MAKVREQHISAEGWAGDSGCRECKIRKARRISAMQESWRVRKRRFVAPRVVAGKRNAWFMLSGFTRK